MFGLPAKSSQSEGQENLLLRFIDKNMFQDKRKDSSGEKISASKHSELQRKNVNKESKQQIITEHLADLFCYLCFDHSSHKSMNRKTAVRTGPRKFSSVYITILAQKGAGKKGGTAA